MCFGPHGYNSARVSSGALAGSRQRPEREKSGETKVPYGLDSLRENKVIGGKASRIGVKQSRRER